MNGMDAGEEAIDQATAEEKLRDILSAVGLPVKASYRPGEVCRILSITEPTFYNLINRYEPGSDGHPIHPVSLDSYRVSHYRVTFAELARFLERNNTWRVNCAADHRQMQLFD